jgi:hypothetical protein
MMALKVFSLRPRKRNRHRCKPLARPLVPTENSVLIEPVELGRSSRYVACDMFAIIFSLFYSIRQGLRARAALHAELVALRRQLLVLERSKRSRTVQLGVADRVFWAGLSRLWKGWRSALVIVKPETVIAWHRRGHRAAFRVRGSAPGARGTRRRLLAPSALVKGPAPFLPSCAEPNPPSPTGPTMTAVTRHTPSSGRSSPSLATVALLSQASQIRPMTVLAIPLALNHS